MRFSFDNIIGIHVILELKAQTLYVGYLFQKDQFFHFNYDASYMEDERSLSLGPEMPLTKKHYQSEQLFVPFTERLPLRENPAYPDYCAQTGISINEERPLVLLATIGSKGPSSFIFWPDFQDDFNKSSLKLFREKLDLTTREFAKLFEFSQATISKIESGKMSGSEVLKRVRLFADHPKLVLEQLKRKGFHLPQKKRDYLKEIL